MTTTLVAEAHVADVNSALEQVIADLADPASSIRAAAAYTLGQYGGADAIALLLHALTDPDPMVREEVTYALELLSDACALSSRITPDAEPEPAVRRTVASSRANKHGHAALRRVLSHSTLS